jgi:hypothetical protein
MPAQMTDGEHNCSSGFHDEEHAERKPVENRAPKFLVDERKSLRTLANPRHRRLKLGDESQPEALALVLVP